MDANRLRFFMLANALDWEQEPVFPAPPPDVVYDPKRNTLRLASLGEERDIQESADMTALTARLARVPSAADRFGTWAFWDGTAKQVKAAGAVPGTTPVLDPAQLQLSGGVTDLAPAPDGLLYAAVGGKVVAKDLRGHWAPFAFPDGGVAAYRVSADPEGGAFVLSGPPDFNNAAWTAKLGRVDGRPLPGFGAPEAGPGVFRPTPENPHLPAFTALPAPVWPGEVPVAIECRADGRLGVLTWITDATAAGVSPSEAYARLRLLADKGYSAPVTLEYIKRPFSLTWLSDDRAVVLVLLADGKVEALAYAIDARPDTPTTAAPQGDVFPLPGHDGGPFLRGTLQPPHHGNAAGPDQPPVPLQALSLPRIAVTGEARNRADSQRRPIDSGDARTVWHRIYLEALLPPRCGVRVFLAATNQPVRPNRADPGWHEHRFGAVNLEPAEEIPQGTWVPLPSELPFHPGMMPSVCAPYESGLFTALVQRPGRRVRNLTGRYLWVRVELRGDSRRTPEIGALRVYASRFSYAENYLPELYREDLFGDDADAIGKATAADFLERFLDNIEGVLTPIEDRIANAHLLTDPRTVPDESLEWLASWVGMTFDPVIPANRRRTLLRMAPALARGRGTLNGLKLALDVVTNGAVTRGSVVVIEDFRLRRTVATILGADLADEDDPLLPGISQSGNSYVGDSLLLGDESTRKELLALYGEDAVRTAAEERDVEAFLARMAHRVTVLLHRGTDPQDVGLIRRVAELEAPAHVEVTVATASTPLMIGVASLVGVDTYLGPPDGFEPLRLGRSILGERDVLERPPSLDPRLEAGA